MSDRDPQVESIDTPGPEDDPKLDLHRITDLHHLSELAQSNTKKVRKLQHLQGSLPDPQNPPQDLKVTLDRRQQLGIRLSRQRDKIKKDHEQEYRQKLEESLRPTTGLLNNQKRELVDTLIKTYERMKDLREKHTGQTEYERRLSARLKNWESTYLTAIGILDKLPPLPSDLS